MPDQRINVCHLVSQLGPAGKEKGILKLIAHHHDQLFNVTIVVMRNIRQAKVLHLEPFNLVVLDAPHGNNMRLPMQLRDVFREHRFDIVHTHSWGTLVEGVVGARLAGVPVVIHGEHGTFPQGPAHRIVQRLFWGAADRVLSVSGILADTLSEVTGFPRQRITTILNGVDESHFGPDAAQRAAFRAGLGLAPDAFVVGAVGRFFQVKNYPMLFRAVRILQERGVDLQLVVAGGGNAEQEAAVEAQLAELGIRERVHLLGFRKDVSAIYNGLDVFALTSFSEGCSNVIQEAVFTGKPVVATKVGGNPELVMDGETGFLVESDNAEMLADRIQALYAGPELRERMGAAALERGRREFSLSVMVERYESIYVEALRAKRPERLSVLDALEAELPHLETAERV